MAYVLAVGVCVEMPPIVFVEDFEAATPVWRAASI